MAVIKTWTGNIESGSVAIIAVVGAEIHSAMRGAIEGAGVSKINKRRCLIWRGPYVENVEIPLTVSY